MRLTALHRPVCLHMPACLHVPACGLRLPVACACLSAGADFRFAHPASRWCARFFSVLAYVTDTQSYTFGNISALRTILRMAASLGAGWGLAGGRLRRGCQRLSVVQTKLLPTGESSYRGSFLCAIAGLTVLPSSEILVNTI